MRTTADGLTKRAAEKRGVRGARKKSRGPLRLRSPQQRRPQNIKRIRVWAVANPLPSQLSPPPYPITKHAPFSVCAFSTSCRGRDG
eukprot:scaffold35213_cov107-Isochrysis_galbana.AAC.2